MIEIRNCTKIFKKNNIEKRALNNVNLKINNSGFVFIVGKSGSGKSTLLNLIANFDTATSGTIIYDDIDLSSLSEKERDQYLFDEVGFVFQTYNLFEELSVKENIALGLKSNSRSLSDEIEKLLKVVDLEGYQNKKVKNLSGGEKQRVALARALIKNPKVLLCDEPCGNLDNVNSRKVLDILKARSKSSLVLIVSHSMNDAYLYADRIITLQEGEVISDKYIDEKEKHNGTYVIKDLNNISNQEFDVIKNGILSKDIDSIRSRKELFKDFDQKIEPKKIERKPKKSHFMKSFFSNIRLINSRIFKMSAFVLITSFALGILSSILPLQRFNPEEFNKKAVLNNSSEIISYDKGYFDGEKENNMFFGKVTDEDKQFINDNYKEKYYERKALSIHNTGTYYQCCNGENTKTNTFSSFYSIELQGLNVVDEAYLKEILQIDDIIITNQTKYENGVYITDYFADSMMFFDGYKDYDNFLEQYNTYDIGQLHNYVRIKGIIKTNYKEKMKSILDQVEQGARVAELLQKEENYKYYDYLRLGLNSAYTFDKNISETAEVNSIYVKWVSTPLGNVTYQNYKPIKIKKQNTVLLPYNTIVAAYPLMKKDEIQKILDTTQFEIAFFTDSSNENDIPRFKAKVNIDARENYSKEINEQHIVNYGPLLSDDLFQTFKEQSIYTYSFLFDDKSIYDINASLFDRHIKLNNIYYNFPNLMY